MNNASNLPTTVIWKVEAFLRLDSRENFANVSPKAFANWVSCVWGKGVAKPTVVADVTVFRHRLTPLSSSWQKRWLYRCQEQGWQKSIIKPTLSRPCLKVKRMPPAWNDLPRERFKVTAVDWRWVGSPNRHFKRAEIWRIKFLEMKNVRFNFT